jgi:hypothetical protein
VWVHVDEVVGALAACSAASAAPAMSAAPAAADAVATARRRKTRGTVDAAECFMAGCARGSRFVQRAGRPPGQSMDLGDMQPLHRLQK